MKRNWLTLAWFLALLLVIGGVFLFGRFETVDEHYANTPEEIPDGADTVTVSVDCLVLDGRLDAISPAVRNNLPDGGHNVLLGSFLNVFEQYSISCPIPQRFRWKKTKKRPLPMRKELAMRGNV